MNIRVEIAILRARGAGRDFEVILQSTAGIPFQIEYPPEL